MCDHDNAVVLGFIPNHSLNQRIDQEDDKEPGEEVQRRHLQQASASVQALVQRLEPLVVLAQRDQIGRRRHAAAARAGIRGREAWQVSRGYAPKRRRIPEMAET